MTFEIWQVADDGTAALVEALDPDDRKAFEESGCRCIETLDADGQEEAQDFFTAWCRRKIPTARETPVGQDVLRAELAKAMAK